MRRGLAAVILFSGLMALFAAGPAEAAVSVSISYFSEQLAPQGQWVVAGSFGDVWVPTVAPGWAPYVNGEWAYTDYGWTWVSYDPFDIPFHYGTWAWDDRYGWVWIPGTVWAPAWVTWAYTDDYVGWAPLPPSFALSVSGYAGSPVVVSETRYVFVPSNRFVGVNVTTARVAPQQSTTIFARANKVTNFNVSAGTVRTAGPEPARIEKAVGRKIERASIEKVKTRPTTLSDAGAAKDGKLQVAAPAEQRKSEIHAASRAPAAKPAAPGSREQRVPAERPQVQTRQEPAPREGTAKMPTARPREEAPGKEPVHSREVRPGETAPPAEAHPEKPEPRSSEQARPSQPRHREKPAKPAKKPTPKPEKEKEKEKEQG